MIQFKIFKNVFFRIRFFPIKGSFFILIPTLIIGTNSSSIFSWSIEFHFIKFAIGIAKYKD